MSSEIALTTLPSLLAACVVFTIGAVLTERVSLLNCYSIPAPIVGGVLYAVLALLVDKTIGFRLTLDISARGPLLLVFFALIGLTADLALLGQGGARLVRFLIVLFPFLLVQNGLGLATAHVLGLHPLLGLVAGSISLVGGHGTGAAYAERFAEEHDLLGVMGLTMTSATIGLVIGGIIGGPVAERLIRRTARADTQPTPDGGVVGGPVTTPVTTLSFTVSLAARVGCGQRRHCGGEHARGKRNNSAELPVVSDRRAHHPQWRRCRRSAAARCGIGVDRVAVPVFVSELDDDDAGSPFDPAPGRATVDHTRSADGAGRRLGNLRSVPVHATRLRGPQSSPGHSAVSQWAPRRPQSPTCRR